MTALGFAIAIAMTSAFTFCVWLGFSALITHLHPKEAEKIIRATGRWFPLRMPLRWPWHK
ncbi:hypothetical protein A5740_19195 [Mycobacterium sp. GA-1841]|uniref:hypothetical protein n=1 Tax=Mycobacterium sp. GA-1841 TaxID=1834154 RepID=UPI00096C224C|nr:hypothetical protein [Mycobacterium sp. GA-1841]OMC28966.1 hypothetical protein A5740_19195 [Mycobacterium sp. GA-1841]